MFIRDPGGYWMAELRTLGLHREETSIDRTEVTCTSVNLKRQIILTQASKLTTMIERCMKQMPNCRSMHGLGDLFIHTAVIGINPVYLIFRQYLFINKSRIIGAEGNILKL